MSGSCNTIDCIPVLATERLLLRAHRPDDFAGCLALWSDPVVTRHIGGRAFSAEEVGTKMLRYAGLWSLLGFGYWLAEDRASGRFAGELGFADFKRDLAPSLGGAPEIGWAFATWVHGAGVASEAVAAIVAWADSHLDIDRTVCLIAPENAASLRVAGKSGYREFARTHYKERPVHLLERRA
jgi:RimJ/RimL family protein N-acetyltransferase